MQKIKAEVVITIPNDMLLITVVEYEQLKQNELSGVYWVFLHIPPKRFIMKNQPLFYTRVDSNSYLMYYR